MKFSIKKLLLILLTLTVILLVILVLRYANPSPEKAFNKFLSSTDLAEDQLKDPLILAGNKVVPIVLQNIENKDMPRRRYAIAFLGDIGSTDAIPALKQILSNKSETDFFRGDALQAIAMIDLNRGKTLAQKYSQGDSYLSMIAKEVLSEDNEVLKRRSYWDAFFSRHD